MQTDDFEARLNELYPLIDEVDLAKYAKLFKHELIASLHNQSSSLPCILNPVYKMTGSPGFGIAVSVGGTNGYVSAFRITKRGVIKFLNRKIFSIPIQTTKDELFHLITKNMLAVASGRKKFPIGIGLAYPLKPLIHHRFIDGELLYMTKGRNIEGLVGKLVGQEYHKFLIKEYGLDTTVAVANDAVCLLLGGDGVEIAGVVGTGLNFAYWERRDRIAPLKLSQLNKFFQREVVVNIESKNFNNIEGTLLRQVVDKKSDDPGFSLAEKEAAGAYLFQIFNAGKEKLLGKDFPDLNSTDELSEILTSSRKSFSGEGRLVLRKYDFSKIKKIERAQLFAERIFHRSAQIVAVELCGILMKIGRISGLVPIVMEGGVFWRVKNYPALVNLYINMILPEVIPSFARLFGSSRRGIAILARSEV